MNNDNSTTEDLRAIRKIMEESTRFLSLSGLSGIFAGIFAVTGAAIAWFLILKTGAISYEKSLEHISNEGISSAGSLLIADAIGVLIFSLLVSVWFSVRNARVKGKRLWTPVSKRLLVNLMIPLITGGILVIILLCLCFSGLVIPCLLLFYGLALVNASKFTFSEVFYLGLLEIITGLSAACFTGYGIIFWIIGFGLLHIIYGILMFRKYEL